LQRTSHPADPSIDAEYQMLCAEGDRADQSPTDSKSVTTYANRLLSAPEYLRINVEHDEWSARCARAAELIGRLTTNMDDASAAETLIIQGQLIAYAKGVEDPTVEQTMRVAFTRNPTIHSGEAVLEVLRVTKRHPSDSIDVCEKTYNIALSQKTPFEELTAIVRTCIQVMPNGHEPEENYKAISAPYWEELRKRAAGGTT
jgi:hypothetical protein